MKNILITLPYSLNYRNIVLSGFVNHISANNKVHLIINDGIKLDKNFLLSENISIEYKAFNISFFSKILYRLLKERYWFIQNTNTYNIKNDKSIIRSLSLLIAPSNLNLLKLLIKCYRWSLRDKEIKKMYSSYDVVISTMAHRWYESKFVLNLENTCKQVNLLHSWDVITTKGTFLFDYNQTLVWNSINKTEYKTYVQKILGFTGIVNVTGALQFHDYNSVSERNPKYILYATSVERLVPDEVLIIESLIEICSNLKLKLKVRNHPQRETDINLSDNNVFYGETDESNSWDNANFDRKFFGDIEYDILNSYCVVSVASTIALDALALGVPAIFIGDILEHQQLSKYYNYNHLSALINKCDIPVVHDLNNLEVQIKGVLQNNLNSVELFEGYLKSRNVFYKVQQSINI